MPRRGVSCTETSVGRGERHGAATYPEEDGGQVDLPPWRSAPGLAGRVTGAHHRGGVWRAVSEGSGPEGGGDARGALPSLRGQGGAAGGRGGGGLPRDDVAHEGGDGPGAIPHRPA